MVVFNHLTANKNVWCESCGDKGHKFYECPEKLLGKGSIYCSICGSSSHPTYDCPEKSKFPLLLNYFIEKKGFKGTEAPDELTIEEEYHNFMQDLKQSKEQKERYKAITSGGDGMSLVAYS
jgi:Zinc knuckle